MGRGQKVVLRIKRRQGPTRVCHQQAGLLSPRQGWLCTKGFWGPLTRRQEQRWCTEWREIKLAPDKYPKIENTDIVFGVKIIGEKQRTREGLKITGRMTPGASLVVANSEQHLDLTHFFFVYLPRNCS